MDISEAVGSSLPHKGRKRVGRGPGSGHGKTSCRGHNGARSRSGWSLRGKHGGNVPMFRRLPKVGFNNGAFREVFGILNVGQLTVFEPGASVTRELLEEKGLLKQIQGDRIKVLGGGELDRPLTVRVDAVSSVARQKIEAAGGKVEVIPLPKRSVRNKMKPKAPRTEEGIP